MKRTWTLATAILLALAVLFTTAIPALAQGKQDITQTENPEGKPTLVKALGIRAPRIAITGEPVTITIYERGSQNVVDAAGVWAISWDKAKELHADMSDLRTSTNTLPDIAEFESKCDLYGEFLGFTNNQGQLTHKFIEPAKYLLVSMKDGYYPGFARITIRNMPHFLGIRAPRIARVNEDVTMTVFERWTQTPVEGAGMWAFSKEDAESLKQDLNDLKTKIQGNVDQLDIESSLNAYGEFLGRTDEQGQIIHAFNRTGNYVLVTWKHGYWPGFGSISVKEGMNGLILRAPRSAQVNQKVTMTVYERPYLDTTVAGITVNPGTDTGYFQPGSESMKKFQNRFTGTVASPIVNSNIAVDPASIEGPVTEVAQLKLDPVPGAGIWAFSEENAQTLREKIAQATENSDTSAQEYDYEALMNAYGEFLGFTNEHGQLTHAFDATGKYVLVTWKKGYLPGFARILIKPEVKALSLRAPRMARVNKDITMTVFERPGIVSADVAPVPVPDAGIWAFTESDADAIKNQIKDLSAQGQTAVQEFNYESILNAAGEFLGYTNEDGQLIHAFGSTGEYILVTWKQGYRPGFARLTVKDAPDVLGIKVPRRAAVGDEVTISVFDRRTQDPVPAADVWAIPWNNDEPVGAAISSVRPLGSNTLDAEQYDSLMNSLGAEYLGQTGNTGELTHIFNETGRYLLITFKDGYWPGFNNITIVNQPQPVEPSVEAPEVLEEIQ